MREVANQQADTVTAAKRVLSIARLAMARSREACSFWRWMWIAQMSFGLTGGFWPTSFPLFHASCLLMAALTDFLLVDRSLILRHTWRRQRSGSKLAAWTATATIGISTVIAAMLSQTRRGRRRAQGVGKVSIAAKEAGEAGRSITQIREGWGRVVPVSDDISSALKEQRFASELIAKQGLEGLRLAEAETTLRPDARQMSQA